MDEGVYRVPLPLPLDGLRAVNVYLIRHESGVTLVDSGWSIPTSRELLLQALAALDLKPSDIDRFLITHVHRDHLEMSVAVRREFSTKIALGRGEKDTIDALLNPDFIPLESHLGRLRMSGASDLAAQIRSSSPGRPDARSLIEEPDSWIEPGVFNIGASRRMTAVATPGHTRGHVVFHDETAGLLYAGDHVLPTITPSIGFEPLPAPNPLGAFLGSLALVRMRSDARLLPAHGPVHKSVHARVDELIAHHARRLDETEHAMRAGCTTALDVATQLGWTRHRRRLAELDDFNKMLAILETAAHLELLVVQGRARVEVESGVNHFVPSGKGIT